jgi:hypothetical protein
MPPDPPEGRIFDTLLRTGVVQAPAVMLRRSAVEEVGGYDETLSQEDFDMWLRLADRFEFRFCAGRLTRKRHLPTSLGHAPEHRRGNLESTARALQKWYGRNADNDAVIDVRLDAIARVAWRAGRRRIVDDRDDGLRLFELSDQLRPSPLKKAFLVLVRAPGARRVLGGVLAARDRLRAR